MLIVGLVLAALAALLHVFIFFLESLAWTSERARATFGTSPEEAQVTKSLAFNQGFYNLFLALMVFGGIVGVGAGFGPVGVTLVLAGVGSMLAAALVLFSSSPAHRVAAIKQGLLPLLAVVVVTIAVLQ
jgi:putative membrane protein